MIHTLKCPSCSAPLDYEDEQNRRSVRCPFCNNLIVVPENLRRGEPQVVITSQTFGPKPRHVKVSPVVPLVIVGVILVFVGGIVYAVIRTINSVTDSVTRTVPPRQPPNVTINVPPIPPGLLGDPTPAPTPGFATTVLKFGSEGIGPGSFNDARSIASDGEGRIYVGEYTGGRVQVFDAAGKFITQWFADRSMPLRGLAADRQGRVYVVQRGKIQRFEGATGNPLGEIQYARDNGFDDVTTTADGGLVAVWDRHTDDLVRFDPSGKAVKVISKAISGQTDRSELNMRVAVDGTGNFYALGTFNDAVLKYTPDGRFVNKFGGSGGEPGQFRAAHAIAVDNKGRVYVSDSKGIQVFDADGRYLDVFKPTPVAFGMTFNDRNELLIAARNQVVKCTLTKP